ncbi:hypothetical protein [Priestia flexa]|uniref:hypothetical protein n=1 Tax=Priestia flexa TaxID=86664 RepID=UPI001F4D17E0|nr:hypothetical protein [Priestia flexa]
MQLQELNFTEDERKLLKKMKKGNQEIQYISSYDGKFLVSFGNSFLKTRAVIIFYVLDGKGTCNGHFGNSTFSSKTAEDNKKNEPFSVFIDSRLDDEIFLHIKEGSSNITHSTADPQNNKEEVLLTFIEDNMNAQLIIYDNRLSGKLAQFIASKEESKDKLRFFAMSYVSQHFPNLFNAGEVEDDENLSE